MTDIAELRKASSAVYLACHEDVAEDVSRILTEAADEIERLRAQVADAFEDAKMRSGVVLSEENDRLIDEIERLRVALHKAEAGLLLAQFERQEAADEIERLRAALKRIAEDDVDDDMKGRANILGGIAWAALTGRKDQR